MGVGIDIAVESNESALLTKGVSMQTENRKFKRYPVPEDALYIFCKESSVKGWVTDISSGGMGVGYFSGEEFQPESEFKLILAGNKVSVYVPDIACKVIYDKAVENRDGRYTGAVARQCGLQFKKLNTETKEKLSAILLSTPFFPKVE